MNRTKTLLCAFGLLGLQAISIAAPAVGQAAPAFSFTTLEGKKLSNASLKGKVVLLDFWASWCGPCKKAAPSVQKAFAKFNPKGFVAIGVDTEDGDTPAAIKAYAKQHGYKYQFSAKNGKTFETAFGGSSIPHFVLIDKKGRIAWQQVGVDENFGKTLEAQIAKLLK